VWDACHAALDAVQPVNHAFVHVLGALGDNVSKYIRWGNHVCPVFNGCKFAPNPSGPASLASLSLKAIEADTLAARLEALEAALKLRDKGRKAR
jgi:hypothetical protein